MRNLVAVSLVAGALVVASGAEAQTPVTFAVEGRGAFAIPTGEWTEDDGVGNGFGFGANAQVLLGAFGIYAGWERFSFGLDDSDLGAGAEADATDTGVRAGLLAAFPVADSAVSIFANAGVIYNKFTISAGDNTGSIDFDADNALGFEAGAGIIVPLGPTLSFTPAVRYRTHKAEFDAFAEFEDNETTVGYFLVDVGLRIGVGQ